MTRAKTTPLPNSRVWKRLNRSSVSWSVARDVTPSVTAIRNRSAIEFKFLLPLEEYRGAEVSLVIGGADYQEVFAAMLKSGIKR